MPIRFLKTFAILLLAVGAASICAQTDGLIGEGFASADGMNRQGSQPAKQKLQKVTHNFAKVQSMYSLENSPEAGPALESIRNLISLAEDQLSAGNNQAVLDLCAQIDVRIGDLNLKGKQKSLENLGAEDPGKNDEAKKTRTDLDLQRLNDRFGTLSQRLEAGKNPCASEVVDRIRSLLARANQEIALDRLEATRALIDQAEALMSQLQRLSQEAYNSDKQGSSLNALGTCEDQQPSAQAALARASEAHRRVLDRFTRMTEQSKGIQDGQAGQAKARIQELLDKAKEALAKGQVEAARELSVKAESLLPELHRGSAATGGDRLSPAGWNRLKAKLERASEIVAASGNEKAVRILEKSQDHFDRAERNHAEGQAGRAEVEVDIALKLAAKAVDIARSSR
ncbi:MAG: hypothetical protein M3Y08_05480 [Fibrobacterota bacterium]|nr:hypothetical protein [Fibrobacterota bacterium]